VVSKLIVFQHQSLWKAASNEGDPPITISIGNGGASRKSPYNSD